MCQMSENINELATALAKAQGELKPAQMNSVNPFLKNRYADLGAVIEAAKAVLPKNGLSYSQFPVDVGENKGVRTILMHASGQWIASTISLANIEERGKSNAQMMGSNISYLRRYALAAIVGIYADEDADGAAKSQPAPAPAKTQKQQTAAPAPATPAPSAPAPAPSAPETAASAGWTQDAKAVKRITNWVFGGLGLSEAEMHEAIGGALHEFAGSEKAFMDAVKAYVAAKSAPEKEDSK